MFIDRLIEEIKSKNSPIVVGLDPRLELMPESILNKHYKEYGYSLEAVKNIILEFNKEIIDNIYDIVPAVKPQIAFYEQYGIEGMEAYLKTCQYAKEKDLLIIGDVKRGDIGTTSRAYSKAHIGVTKINNNSFTGFPVDSITINPYFGDDCIGEFIDDIKNYDKGVFILVKTSNPGSGQLQDLMIEKERVYEVVARIVDKWSDECIGAYGYSSIGAVVGANYPEEAVKLRKLLRKSYILIPGYGAQGGTADDVIHGFNNDGLGAIVNSSRGILYSYKKKGASLYGLAAREETLTMKDKINKALKNHYKL